ncbi:MAG: signal peptidase I, partial [Planctomycetaceae bacterium]
EAFVIPTGSMAPTLYGRHKDLTCEKCGYHFAIGASDEVKSPGYLIPNQLIEDAMCPNCRYVTPKKVVQGLPAFKGDRILVNKYPYEFSNPKRWDVVVFKFPEEPQTNYIKRLVGLPGDALEIRQGDVYTHTKDKQVRILRKDDPNKQRKLQILVHDNDYAARDLLKAGWPERWAALKRSPAADRKAVRYPYEWSPDDAGWAADAKDRTFSLSPVKELRWLRYRHFVPGRNDWKTVNAGGKPESPQPRLITDFCGYNAYTGGQPGNYLDEGTYWVGDLTINCEVNVEELGDQPELLLELLEGQRTYRCRFDIETGECTIFHLDDQADASTEVEKPMGTATTRLKGTGRHAVSFANVDDRLCVWVDDVLIDFGAGEDGTPNSHYRPFHHRKYQRPTRGDLSPVGVAARGCEITVSRLLLQRDIYYRAEQVIDENDYSDQPDSSFEYTGEGNGRRGVFPELNKRQHDPEEWWKLFSGKEDFDPETGERTYPHLNPARFPRLAAGEFFMMGDNSPRSRDSRIWPNAYRKTKHRFAVPRSALVGKAFYIYWPHGKPFLNGGKGFPVWYHRTVTGEATNYPSFRIPFYPNFERMRRIW